MGAGIFQIAGQAVGSFFGGPIGGFVGSLVGGAIGGAVFKPKTIRNRATPISDLRVIGTEYGQCIPNLIGSHAYAGQLWWNSIKHQVRSVTRETQGGGKGGGSEQTVETETLTYDIDVLIGFTDHEIDGGFARIFFEGKLVATFDVNATQESLNASANAETWNRITFYKGTNTQMPDPTYEAAIQAEFGLTAPVPAYRNRSYIFIAGLHLGTGGVMRNITAEVVTDGVIGGIGDDLSITPIITGTTVPAGNDYFETPVGNGEVAGYYGMRGSGLVWIHQKVPPDRRQVVSLVDIATGTIVQQFTEDMFPAPHPSTGDHNFAIRGVSQFDSSCYIALYVDAVPTENFYRIYKLKPDGTIKGYLKLDFDAGVHGVHVDASGDIWVNRFLNPYDVVWIRNINWDSALHEAENYLFTTAFPSDDNLQVLDFFLVNALGIPGRVYCHTGASNDIAYININTLSGHIIITNAVHGASHGTYPAVVGDDQNIYWCALTTFPDSTTIKKSDKDGVLLGSLVLPGFHYNPSLYTSDGFVWLHGPINTNPVLKMDPVTMTIVQTVSNDGPDVPLPGVTYHTAMAEPMLGVVAFYLNTGPGGIGVIGPIFPTIAKVCVTVQEAQRRLCVLAGYSADQFDVTALSAITDLVCDLPLSQVQPMRTPSELLMSLYHYTCVARNKLIFFPLGAAAVATIPYADLGAAVAGSDTPEPLDLQLATDIELPARMALTTFNIDKDYEPATQYSDRLVTAVEQTVDVQELAIGLHQNKAKAAIDTIALSHTVSLWTGKISVFGGKYAHLQAGDPILVVGKDGSIYRFRITQLVDSYPLFMLDVVLDDTSILLTAGITTTDFQSQTVVRSPADTLMRLLDIPILRDSDNNAGIYAVVKGDGTPYPGSAIFDSADDVVYSQRVSIRETGVFGLCVTALGDWTGPRVIDEQNVVRVNVGDGTLTSSTYDEVLADQSVNAYAIGNDANGYELGQFITAMPVATGVYDLSRLLRGSRGTEWAMTGHTGGEKFILLRAFGMRRLGLSNDQLGIERYYAGVTLGRPLSSATAQAFTANAIGLKPFSPAGVMVIRDGSGNITFTVDRRSRLTTRTVGPLGVSIPLGEDFEQYEIDVYAVGSPDSLVTTITGAVGTNVLTYSDAQQILNFGSGQSMGNLSIKTFQISASVGRGTPLESVA